MSASRTGLGSLCRTRASDPTTELEIRFGTRGEPVDRIGFDRIIAKLKSEGFTVANSAYFLRVQAEYLDPKTGRPRLSNVRVTVSGLSAIRDYCKSNEIASGDRGEPLPGVSFELKTQHTSSSGARTAAVDFDDWNMRVSLQKEEQLTERDGRVKQLLSEWATSRKVYRLIKRSSLRHTAYPIVADLSVVRSSQKARTGRMLPAASYTAARVSEQPDTYEVELEVPPHRSYNAEELEEALRKTSKTVLAALQDSNYPIPESETTMVVREYFKMVNGEPPNRVRARDFIGPSSVSLELPNITSGSDAKIVATSGYAVTDKADGLRKMLYVAKNGKAYFIDTNMAVQFTGMMADTDRAGTLIDGEHIMHDKFGGYYDRYAAFDCYFVDGRDVRREPLITEDNTGGRLRHLSAALAATKLVPLVPGARIPQVLRKDFYSAGNVFANCAAVAAREAEGAFEYETDGMMLTPTALGVGMGPNDKSPPNRKRTWQHSFKWKPPSHNTIDFLCTVVKGEGGAEALKTVFTDGTAMSQEGSISQYMSFVLRVGYDERMHGYLNPCQQVLEGDYPVTKQSDRTSEYKPAPFNPTNPSDPSASLCNVMVDPATLLAMTEDKKGIVEDATIVEFRYDPLRDPGWRWIPIKVRHDKTADMRSGGRNYGNAYHVAESVWTSIHNPVTLSMLTTGEGIPDVETDAYYLSAGASTTSPMRDFHNIAIKRKLLRAVIRPGGAVLDLGCGKAGDLHKWIASRAGLVVGIDSCRDCIENRIDGACARYLNAYTSYKTVPPMFFLFGEATKSLKSGEGLSSAAGKRTMRALLGEGPRDKDILGDAVFRNYGKAQAGFDVITCQFALHYFFKDLATFDGMLDNIDSLCGPGGYFVGACYDGKRVFRALEDKQPGEGLCLRVSHETICEITKQYDATTYPDGEASLGYAVDVYQDSINNTIREYLVNFGYLEHRLAERGLRPVTAQEARGLGLLGAVVPFGDVFQQLQLQASGDRRLKASLGDTLDMTPEEKQVSFLNNMFAFKRAQKATSGPKATKRRRKLVIAS